MPPNPKANRVRAHASTESRVSRSLVWAPQRRLLNDPKGEKHAITKRKERIRIQKQPSASFILEPAAGRRTPATAALTAGPSFTREDDDRSGRKYRCVTVVVTLQY